MRSSKRMEELSAARADKFLESQPGERHRISERAENQRWYRYWWLMGERHAKKTQQENERVPYLEAALRIFRDAEQQIHSNYRDKSEIEMANEIERQNAEIARLNAVIEDQECVCAQQANLVGRLLREADANATQSDQ